MSSLSNTADRSVYQLRPGTTQDNWGGDETVSLSVLTDSLPMRLEWSGGKSTDWDAWCFDLSADIQEDDILLVEDPDMILALMVVRVTPFTSLKSKRLHHYEIICEEHELSVVELKTEAGI